MIYSFNNGATYLNCFNALVLFRLNKQFYQLNRLFCSIFATGELSLKSFIQIINTFKMLYNFSGRELILKMYYLFVASRHIKSYYILPAVLGYVCSALKIHQKLRKLC